jgi:predicted nucleic acid-binding protein
VPRVYLDACCLNRPFDDQTQARIRLEAEAVLIVVAQCESGQWEWVTSEAMDVEITRTPDPERRRRVRFLAAQAHHSVIVGDAEIRRAQRLESWGIAAYDALHVACAESANADVLLTTDDRLLRKCVALGERLRVWVKNPLEWLEEEN